ncbi:tetratricopeptide repeat protein [Actinokineospora diospyrosa]|uniref:Tetratricopeptide repeat-containing protein n=1 Tax=Actinokineospora diospyrosa TaxID=103728 RepID=A0ABT1IDN7_9PSEU|nr:tetratricopeptide repeat protein [Actinokineospora diospyrosa]MCP2270481.1 Tetratricopeptide repeat-containing protein [Actinokineospora diospyrosa]
MTENVQAGHVSGNVLQTGAVHGNVYFNAAPQQRLPYRSGAVPVVVDGFQPRSVPDLEALTAGGVVLSGLGGVGKTQLAADYANRTHDVELLGWVTASTRAGVINGFAELGAVVTGQPVDDEKPFLDWCATTTKRWLLVFDDLTDPADIVGLWPHTRETGRLVVTTRRNEPSLRAADRLMVDLRVFTPEESLSYLGETGEELANLLGHLPLALGQATAYVSMVPGMTYAKYVRKWRTEALDAMFPTDWTSADGRSDTVVTTWAISVAAADRLAPVGAARAVLDVISVLSPDGIPLSLLAAAAPGVDTEGGLTALRRFSLITVGGEPDPLIRAHALVQHATRAQLDDLPSLIGPLVGAFKSCWPAVERVPVFRANAIALTEHCGPHLWTTPGYALLFRVADSLGNAGQVLAAAERYREIAAEAQARLGPDHVDALAARQNAARWRGELGDSAGAARDLAALLPDLVRVLGEDHPFALLARNSLALWRGESGDVACATTILADLLVDAVRVFGPHNADTLGIRCGLAHWLGVAGDVAGAVREYTAALDDIVRVLGPDDLLALASRHNLAHWRQVAGDGPGAVAELAGLLDDQRRVLGPEHPNTLATRNNLAACLADAGDPVAAARAYADLLADQLRVLDQDHPATLITRRGLADCRGMAGDAVGAVDALFDLLADQSRVLGPDHPATLRTRGNLAMWRGKAEGAAVALAELTRLRDDVLRVLGQGHPENEDVGAYLDFWRQRLPGGGGGAGGADRVAGGVDADDAEAADCGGVDGG